MLQTPGSDDATVQDRYNAYHPIKEIEAEQKLPLPFNLENPCPSRSKGGSQEAIGGKTHHEL